jgi:uncharacterized membrane protein YvbJ
MSDTKLCPYCGEEVKAEAKKCKYCHSMLENEPAQARQQAAPTARPAAQPTAAKKPIYKRWWAWVAAIVVLFLFIASSGSGDKNPATSTPASTTSTVQNETPAVVVPMVVTTDKLIDDLRDNALKASGTYKDQHVELTGKLSNIDSNGKYFSLSKLSDEFSFDSILCRIDENHLDTVMNFTMGQNVTVTGKITDVGEVMGYTMKVETIK